MKTSLNDIDLTDYTIAQADYAGEAVNGFTPALNRCQAKLRELQKATRKGRDTATITRELHDAFKDLAAHFALMSKRAEAAGIEAGKIAEAIAEG
jgi:hypothetical protein